MAPFPEAEDMTVKRLYVALKRNDMQLLQMGAHKLHEKFHTGHRFELLDDLRQILSYVQEQEIPSDIKDLLLRTIGDILNGNTPEISYVNNSAPEEEFEPFEDEETTEETQSEAFQSEAESENFTQDETAEPQAYQEQEEPVIFTPKEEEFQSAPQTEEAPVQTSLFMENAQETAQEQYQEQPYQETYQEPMQDSYQEPAQENSYVEQPTYEPQNYEEQAPQEEPAQEQNWGQEDEAPVKILEEQEITLKDVAIFYDDKAPILDFTKNREYRNKLEQIGLGADVLPLNDASAVKSLVDVQTEDIGEILKMLNTIKGEVFFVTTSKSENIIKTFIENNVNFEIPLISQNEYSKTKLIPLFGLSNVFVCPKCGKKEYFGGFHNKVLSMQCKSCQSVMYPNVYEAQNLDTNANPYYWIKGISAMAKADTWILINPPLENNRALAVEFIRASFEISKPKKVYILSKETTKKEYYKQMFKEIDENCIINTDYITQDNLCEDFINNEMASIKVNI